MSQWLAKLAPSSLWLVALTVLVLNLPFGFWRAGTRKFTFPWFLAVHAPVPLVVGLRMLAGVRLRIGTFLLLAGAFFTGQFFGARLRAWWSRGG